MNQALKYNREGWLTELARLVEPAYRGFRLPPYRVTCGWPCVMGLSRSRRRVGECHGPKSSSGGVFEIFVSPVLDKPADVAGTLCHELAHVAAGIEAGHRAGFVKVARHVGLTKGRPAEVMPGRALAERLARHAEALGPYPHQALVPAGRPARRSPPVRLACARCGCRVTISRRWLDAAGAPVCACGGPMIDPDGDGEEGGED